MTTPELDLPPHPPEPPPKEYRRMKTSAELLLVAWIMTGCVMMLMFQSITENMWIIGVFVLFIVAWATIGLVMWKKYPAHFMRDMENGWN